ncbi:acyl-CoA dehydrogenase family protein [Catellatospora sp. KI3]|uniref:acyl-CoA dehydrogenase family protein n=1 Tax=Catellatospora sp. KI3 TaxID=3041620 RepID=UPI00248257AF|nr:acyl-CoA dehydrogenase family protein [Catellatospora sp. KI3]MDI1460807.1 acyl-CoA dehydrogenase family protein [Catellatospora sp. KI3]
MSWVEQAAELAGEFAQRAAEFDETAQLPTVNLRRLHEAGFDMAWLPHNHGGQGLSWVTFGRVLATIASACPSTATIWLMHLGAAYGLVHMSGEDNAGFFARELAGGKRFANALSEPTSGNLFLMPLQTARPTDGGFVLDGAKRFVSGCEIADYLLVNALVDDAPAFFGITPDDTLKLVPIWDSVGLRATRSQLITFEGTVLPEDRRCTRFTEEPNPIPIGLPFLSIGVAEAALAALRQHAAGRVIPTTGQPLADMQWVQFAAATEHVRLRAATLLAAHTAWLADQRSPLANPSSLEAKLLANEVAKDVAALGVKVGGGSGYLKNSPIQRHFRDAQAGALMAYSAEVCQAEIGKAIMTP